MEQVTSTSRLQMQLPPDPSGVSHILAIIYRPGANVAVGPITMHGSDGRCNAAFNPSDLVNRPAIGTFTSYAIRYFVVAATSSDYQQQLAASCSSQFTALVNITTVRGGVGSCVPSRYRWSVVQMTSDGLGGSMFEFSDSICQNYSTSAYGVTARYPMIVNHCVQVSFDTNHVTYALLQHGLTESDAVAALAAYVPPPVIPVGPSSTGISDDDHMSNASDSSGGDSSSFPLTTLGTIIASCTGGVLLVSICKCWYDTRRRSARAAASIHPHPTFSTLANETHTTSVAVKVATTGATATC
jgi:hypothetical protein